MKSIFTERLGKAVNKKIPTEKKLVDKYQEDIERMHSWIGTGSLEKEKTLTKINQFEKSFTELQTAIGDRDQIIDFPNEQIG